MRGIEPSAIHTCVWATLTVASPSSGSTMTVTFFTIPLRPSARRTTDPAAGAPTYFCVLAGMVLKKVTNPVCVFYFTSACSLGSSSTALLSEVDLLGGLSLQVLDNVHLGLEA